MTTIERLQALSTYYWRINQDSALYYARLSGVKAEQLNNKRLLGNSKFLEGNVFLDRQEGAKARELYDEAIVLYKTVGEKEKLLETNSNYGSTYMGENNYSEAKKWIHEVLEEAKKQNLLKIQAYSAANLGLIADMEGDKPHAIELYTTATKYYEQIGDKGRVAILKHNTGALYSNMDDQQQAIKYTLEACKGYLEVKNFKSLNNSWLALIYYYKEIDSLQLAENYIEKLKTTSFPLNESQKSQYFLLKGQLSEKKREYSDAISLIDSCINIAISANSPMNLHNGYATKARILLQQKNYQLALQNARLALELALKINDPISINLDQKFAAQAAQGLGQQALSLNYWNAYEAGRDTLYNQEKFQAIENIQKKYETEKKEILIESQQTTLKQQRIILFVGSIVLLLAILAGLLLFKNNIEKRKVNRLLHEQNEQLLTANEEFVKDLEKTKQAANPTKEVKDLKIKISQRNGKEISLGEIIYIEGNGNFVTFHTTSGIFHDWQYVSHYEDMLANSNLFCRTHRSYLVNRLHVVKRKSQELTMSNGHVVAIASTTSTKSAVHEWFEKWETL